MTMIMTMIITMMMMIIIIIIRTEVEEVAWWCMRSLPLTMYVVGHRSAPLSTNRVKQEGGGGGVRGIKIRNILPRDTNTNFHFAHLFSS